MPELPEVETIRRQLSLKIIGKKLDNKKIINVRRRAKILIIEFENNLDYSNSKKRKGNKKNKELSYLIFHLKLTGQLIFNGKPSPYTRKVFNFEDNSCLIFNDMRKFGWYKKIKSLQELEKKFGQEALEISFLDFEKSLKKRPKSKIKNLLMDQKFIAGIGNIYSDEILFLSKVFPLRMAKDLKNEEIKKIHQNIKKVLKKAIEKCGSSVSDYLDASGQKGNFSKYHKVYQKTGQKCIVCKTEIKRVKQFSRHAHFCPNCQK